MFHIPFDPFPGPASSQVNRELDRARSRSGVRRRAATTDVDAFLEASGLRGRRR